MLSHIGVGELLVLFFIVLLLFGPQRLPDLAASIGKSLKLFKQGLREGDASDPRSESTKTP